MVFLEQMEIGYNILMQHQPNFPSGNLPDLWGRGAAFAFSGLEGSTSAASGFVATLGAERYSLRWHTPTPRLLQIRLPTIDNPLLVGSDVLLVETQAEELFIAFWRWHTLVGLAPTGTGLRLALENGPPAEERGQALVSIDPQGKDALALMLRGPMFSLAYGQTPEQAVERAGAGLESNLDQIAQERLRIFGDVPGHPDQQLDRLLKKCLAVMKVNTLGPEGLFRQAWSAPGRPSRCEVGLRDSVFCALAMSRVYPGVAWQVLKSVLDTQNPDGMIPQRASAAGWKAAITHGPMLAWGVWEVSQRLPDAALMEYAFPRLEDYIDWDTGHRDRNRNGLLEWSEGDAAAAEADMPGFNRFREGLLLDAVDFSVLAAQEMHCIGDIAAELGHADDARYWHEKAVYTSLKIHELLWDEADGFYYDRHMDGSVSRVPSVAGLMPLLLDNTPPQRVDRLVARLREPGAFNTASTAYAPMNYLLILGLRRHGREADAARLRARTIEQVLRLYERHGVLFEFHDAATGEASGLIDHHPTAAAMLCLLLEEAGR
jgi:hypothetical protein